MSFVIPAWQTTALVWRSGVGKSTMIKMILWLIAPTHGTITIDDQRLYNPDGSQLLLFSSLYDHVGYVAQDGWLFDGTVKENLVYGVHDRMSDDDLWGALEKAQLADRIRQTPEGLDTQIGERWIKLSGWEKQRLALARLFLRNPSIIILDEPTAALDSESESLITDQIKSYFANKTVIVIAHRLQTVMHADQIVVMEQGTIVEIGKHDALIAQWWSYAWLVDLQHGRIGE